MAKKKTQYYDWGRTLSYYNRKERQAEYTMVIGGKEIGKTFGLRKWMIERYIKTGERFCQLCRRVNVKEKIEDDYTEKLQFEGFFEDYVFKTEKDKLLIAPRPRPYWVEGKDGESVEKVDKPEWETCGYFAALPEYIGLKERTFVNVCTIAFDEALLEREQAGQNYLRNEFTIFLRCCSSIWREKPGDPRNLRCVLMSNAVDFINPYFAAWNINEPPRTGYSWHRGKSLLIDMVDMDTIEGDKGDTLVSRMMDNSRDRDMAYSNKFKNYDTNFIAPKTPEANFDLELVYRGESYGLWYDSRFYYFSEKVADGKHCKISFHIEDATLECSSIMRSSAFAQTIRTVYFSRRLRFENAKVRDAMFQFLKELGVR